MTNERTVIPASLETKAMHSDGSTYSRILGGLWGVAVGDALGVPVEFCSREERDRIR